MPALPEPHEPAEDDVPGWCQFCELPIKHPVHITATPPARQPATPQQRDAWVEKALANAPTEWLSRAVLVLRDLANSAKRFTSEDITDRVGLPRGEQHTANQNNAVGGLISSAKASGLIAKVERESRQSRNHSDIAVWVGSQYAHLYNRPDYQRGETA